jgi:hypothetical protein
MKPVAVFILVTAISVAALAANAKTVTNQASTNDRMVSGVAGPVASADTSQRKTKADAKKAKGQTNMAAKPTKTAPTAD